MTRRQRTLLTAFVALVARELPRANAERLRAGATPGPEDLAAATRAGRAALARRPQLARPLAAIFLAEREAFNATVREGLGGILDAGRYPGSPASSSTSPRPPQASDPTPEGAQFTQEEVDRYEREGSITPAS